MQKEMEITKAEQERLATEKAKLDAGMEAAATKVQAIQRGRADRRNVETIKAEKLRVQKEMEIAKAEQERLAAEKAKLDAEMEAAATKVQAIQRGRADVVAIQIQRYPMTFEVEFTKKDERKLGVRLQKARNERLKELNVTRFTLDGLVAEYNEQRLTSA